VTRIAIPIFRLRVSPVFDSSTRILFIDIEKDREVDRKEIYLDELSLTERVRIFQKSGITTVICGGISDVMESMLSRVKIDLISNISGEIEQVLAAYLTKRLDNPRFLMPGVGRNFFNDGVQTKERNHESH